MVRSYAVSTEDRKGKSADRRQWFRPRKEALEPATLTGCEFSAYRQQNIPYPCYPLLLNNNPTNNAINYTLFRSRSVIVVEIQNGSRKPERKRPQEGRQEEVPRGSIANFYLGEENFSESPLFVMSRRLTILSLAENKEHHGWKRVSACARRYGFDYAREAEKRFITSAPFH